MYWGWSRAPVLDFGRLRVGFKCRGGGRSLDSSGPCGTQVVKTIQDNFSRNNLVGPPPFDSTLRRGEFGSDLSRNKQPAVAAQQSRKQQQWHQWQQQRQQQQQQQSTKAHTSLASTTLRFRSVFGGLRGRN